jgi:hypothetical protein
MGVEIYRPKGSRMWKRPQIFVHRDEAYETMRADFQEYKVIKAAREIERASEE